MCYLNSEAVLTHSLAEIVLVVDMDPYVAAGSASLATLKTRGGRLAESPTCCFQPLPDHATPYRTERRHALPRPARPSPWWSPHPNRRDLVRSRFTGEFGCGWMNYTCTN